MILLHYNNQMIEDEEMCRVFDQLVHLNPQSNGDYTWDELGMAHLFVDLYGEDLKYCPDLGAWFIWDGTRWGRQTDAGVVKDRIETMLNLLLHYAKDIISFVPGYAMQKEFTKFVQSLRKVATFNAILEAIKMNSRIRFLATDWDKNPYLLNTPACAYDLRTMKPVEERDSVLLTQVTECNLEPTFPVCERWYRFIDEIMCGDKDKARFLQRALGYSVLGINREECMFVAYGQSTRNGKGTLFSAIQGVLGKEYAQGADPDLICESKTGKTTDFNSAQPGLRKLVNSRLVVMSESDKGVRLATASIKAMTGRDTMTTRGLYEDSFDFVPQFKLWLNTNYLPAVTDDTIFNSDRIWVIKFLAHFDEEHRDLDLKSVFADPKNKPTILAWLLDGMKDYMAQGLNPPEVVRDDTFEYRDRYDKIGNFLRECTVPSPDSNWIQAELYKTYCSWCCRIDNKINPMVASLFYTELELRGYNPVRLNGEWVYRGIKPKTRTGDESPIITLV